MLDNFFLLACEEDSECHPCELLTFDHSLEVQLAVDVSFGICNHFSVVSDLFPLVTEANKVYLEPAFLLILIARHVRIRAFL